jgi:hypothetical protein
MQEIAKVSDDVFDKETANTIFEDYYVYLAMSMFCRFENRTYTGAALFRELHKVNPEIKREDISSILNSLLNKNYIGKKGGKLKHYFPREEGIEAFKDVHFRLLKNSEYSEKKPKLRKSFFQEYHEAASFTGYNP